MAKRAKAHPADTVESWTLDKIIPYERNPRTHPPEQITLLARLMREHGIDQPIVVDEAGVILKGHGRLLAAREAGFSHFPVVAHRGLSEDEKRAIRVADNQVALLAGWDGELLRSELDALQLAGFDMPLLGFDNVQLVQFLAGMGEHADAPMTDEEIRQTLADRFGVVPFSVFNAREGWWQDRKRAWIGIGIQSELGRGENLLEFSDSVRLDGKAYNERFKGKRPPAVPEMTLGGEV